ncbi:hypothetical protein F2P81_006477 [Scophthalmus maximus]|uniref:Uncharacterized protein n=1 Tax=Scophthalmus maximus TaxID=52904 RepID=A0A6A4T6S7_SCOMX|nr:hypothetical protein F2P81_006477 [Scophthalmus maximus]
MALATTRRSTFSIWSTVRAHGHGEQTPHRPLRHVDASSAHVTAAPDEELLRTTRGAAGPRQSAFPRCWAFVRDTGTRLKQKA